jgi:hypothetical protein
LSFSTTHSLSVGPCIQDNSSDGSTDNVVILLVSNKDRLHTTINHKELEEVVEEVVEWITHNNKPQRVGGGGGGDRSLSVSMLMTARSPT